VSSVSVRVSICVCLCVGGRVVGACTCAHAWLCVYVRLRACVCGCVCVCVCTDTFPYVYTTFRHVCCNTADHHYKQQRPNIHTASHLRYHSFTHTTPTLHPCISGSPRRGSFEPVARTILVRIPYGDTIVAVRFWLRAVVTTQDLERVARHKSESWTWTSASGQ